MAGPWLSNNASLWNETAIGLMALDESHYFDMTDYELELEVEDHEQGNRISNNFLEENQISQKKPLQNWFDLSKAWK